MKGFLIMIVFSLLYWDGHCQIVKGTVRDQNTGNPIEFAAVYFNGTFIGTNTDKNGNFELDRSGNSTLPLTISALGYYSIDLTDLSRTNPFVIYMQQKSFDLAEVVIDAGKKQNKREREKNLNLFRRQFLGETPNARLCRILNEDDIHLVKVDDTLKAFSSKPVLLENQALGYKITFFMDKFEYIPAELLMIVKGNIFFNEDLNSKESKEKRFVRNRNKTYSGSRMQFFRALWDNKLDSAGFTIKDSLNRKLTSGDLLFHPDSSAGNTKCLKGTKELFVSYKSESTTKMPLNAFLTKPGSYVDYEEGSRIDMLKDSVNFDRNGASIEGIRWYGRMSKQRIADTLPYEYAASEPVIRDSADSLKEDSIQRETKGLPLKEPDSQLPSEKVFLHLDRPNYMQGDTIWFKAYAWFGFEQLPDTVSKVLYVELLNSKDSVVIRKKLLIQSGTSMGEFNLNNNIQPGRYLVRAYTRWMQNKNTGEPFYQSINIGGLNQNIHVDCSPLIIRQKEGDSLKVTMRFFEISPEGDLKSDFVHRVDYRIRIGDQLLDSERALSSNSTKEQVLKFPLPGKESRDSVARVSLSIKEKDLEYEKQFSIPLNESLDLQFFPEGGNLIEGIKSRIAYKAAGDDGLGRTVKGVIKSEEGEVITSFESSDKGMGDFYLTPAKESKKYRAFLSYNGKELRFALTVPGKEGCVIAVEKGDSLPVAVIGYSPSLENSNLYLAGSAYGKLRFVVPLKLSPDSCRVNIPVGLLPEGVSRLTLLTVDFKPLCERLFYIDKGERFKVELKADSVSYGNRSKVTLHIKTTTSDGEPVPANLSLAVTDKDQVIGGGNAPGISAYKLLRSELRGCIQDPAFYFRGDSVNHRELDLLMLTQGYRQFQPDSTMKTTIKYLPERSFDINGRVALSGKKPKNFNYSSLGLTLLCPSDKTFFDQTKSDSLGNFSFRIPLLQGKPLSLLKAYTANGKLTREKLPKEKSFKGDILLNEEKGPLFVSPLLPEITKAIPVINWVQQLQTAKRAEISRIKNADKWHLDLPEVTITARHKDKNWYTRFEDEAKKIVDMDSIDPTGRKYESLNDLLVREFDARKCFTENRETETILLPCLNMDVNRYYPVYLLNGKTFCNAGEDSILFISFLRNLSSLRVNEIKRLLVLPPGDIVYHYADPSVLSATIRLKEIFNQRVCPPYSGCHSMKQSMVVIETYSKKNFYRGDPDGIKTFILEGLDAPRSFYSPRYEGPNSENPVYDSRATLYWKPFVRTNEKGESKIEFYTGDRKTGLAVTVTGIDIRKGATGQGEGTILVK